MTIKINDLSLRSLQPLSEEEQRQIWGGQIKCSGNCCTISNKSGTVIICKAPSSSKYYS